LYLWASWWVAQWGGVVACFVALPAALIVDRQLRRTAVLRWRRCWWLVLWASVAITVAAQTMGTLDALQLTDSSPEWRLIQ